MGAWQARKSQFFVHFDSIRTSRPICSDSRSINSAKAELFTIPVTAVLFCSGKEKAFPRNRNIVRLGLLLNSFSPWNFCCGSRIRNGNNTCFIFAPSYMILYLLEIPSVNISDSPIQNNTEMRSGQALPIHGVSAPLLCTFFRNLISIEFCHCSSQSFSPMYRAAASRNFRGLYPVSFAILSS